LSIIAGGNMNRKDLTNKYKQTIQPMGIYQIRNMINGKIFLGSAKNLQGIINSNKFRLKNGLHRNKEMQNDFNEVGEKSFSFEILDYLKPTEDLKCDYAQELRMLEDMWLEKLQPYDERGYNTKNR
jgi:group I intron endonuclease